MIINARMLITALFFIGLTPLWAQNQRLTWTGDEYAMRYEVIIEKEEGGEYANVLREFTEESFIEVSLPSGKYRCQVIPYDFLNQPVPVTEWMDFEVRPSFHEIIMVSEIPSTDPEPEKATAYPNQFDLYLSASWISFLPIYNGNTASSFGTSVRFGFVSAQRRFFNPGMELTASWRINTLLFDCYMIQQSRFIEDRIAFNLRLGVGVSLTSGDDSWWAAGKYSTHFTIGASFFCLVINNVYFETGMEYSQLFTKDFDYFLRPWIGVGYRF